MTKILATLALLACLPLLAFAAVEIGEPVPDFTLTDTEGEEHRLADYLAAGNTVVLEWFNPDCPFIKKHHERFRTMNDLYEQVKEEGVVWLAINSSAPGREGHGLKRNRRARKDYAMEYPVLIDEKGKVGRNYGAKTTPHMFVIAPDGKLAYQGAIDDDRSTTKRGGTNYVAAALASLQAGDGAASAETRPYGCSVKYSD
jgi:peroxiredoxin